MLVAPTPLAFENAATVTIWFTGAPSTTVTDWVLVTCATLSEDAAFAVQISETPREVLARATRVQVRPAPEIVINWLFAPVVGPSDATRATSTVEPVVLNGAVVCAPVPFAETSATRVGTVAAGGAVTVMVTAALALPPRPSEST